MTDNNDSLIKIGEKDIEYIEYKLTSKIEQTIYSRAWKYSVIFFAGVTCFGILGLNYIVETASKKVELEVVHKIDRETAVLEARLRENLADFSVKATEIKRKSEDAKNHLDKLLADYQTLDDMKKRNESLYVEVDKLQNDVKNVSELSSTVQNFKKKMESEIKTAEEKINHLTGAVLKVASNKPGIVKLTQDVNKKTITITGFNFEKVGSIKFRPSFKVEDGTGIKPYNYRDWYEIEKNDILRWDINEIQFFLSSKQNDWMQKAIFDMENQLLKEKLVLLSKTQQVQIVTGSHKFYEFYTSDFDFENR
jgi:HD superfamily phosphohydrolase